MRFRKLAGTAVVTAGVLAAANRGLRYDGDLARPLAGDGGTYRWRGMDVAYTEDGDPEDPDLVCLHGIHAAATSGEWRGMFGDLAADYHVLAPDLPGFGLSDRPPLRYSAALYEDFVREYLAEFDEPRVVASSLTAAYVVSAARDADVDVSGLVLVCPTAVAGPDPPKTWLRELFRSPLVGQAAFNLLTSKPSIRYFNADLGYYDPSRLDGEWIDYEWKTAHAAGARFAPASFVAGFLNADVDVGDALADIDVPATIVWGREARIPPLSAGRDLAERGDARLVVFDRAKLLPHVEYPDQFVEAVREGLTVDAAP